VAAGYGVLLLSFGFNVHKWLAILIAVAMLVSALAALLLVPSLILTFRPAFIYKRMQKKLQPAPAVAALVVFVFLAAIFPESASADDIDLTKIMEKNFIATKVVDSVFESTFTLTNKGGQERIRKTMGTTKLAENGIDNMRMTRFLSPPDVKGTVSLMVEHSTKDDDIWIYLPALQKVRRLVSSNKKDSFVGTDFSYGDVIGYKVGDWKYKLIKEETIDDHANYVIESTPVKNEVGSANGLSKRVEWIRQDNYVTTKAEYWDNQGQLFKTAQFNDIQLVDKQRNKWQPMELVANNLQTGNRTTIRFNNFKVNQKIKDDFFSTRYMTEQ
jgi:hypothetical protein